MKDMKKNIIQLILTITIVISNNVFAQKTEQKLYDKYLEEMEKKEYPKALKTLENYIQKFPDSKNIADIYYEKAQLNIELNNNEAAINDFTIAYKKDSTFTEAISLRGNLKYKMDKLEEALEDYNLSLRINPKLAESYARIAFVYKKQSKTKEACLYFEKALSYGMTSIEKNILEMCDTNSVVLQKYLLKILVDKSTDPEYGFSDKNPIKIGPQVKKERIFLSLLRDTKGKPINYKRLASCCPYASKNGMFGMALCDKYEVELDGENKILYISFYDSMKSLKYRWVYTL